MKKRYCCQIAAAVGVALFLIYHVIGAQSFSALQDSELEERVSDGEWITIEGQIYRKIRKAEGVDLLLLLKEQQEFIYVSMSDEESLDDLKIGQRIRVSGEVMLFSESPNPGNFNQKFYYKKEHICLKLRKSSAKLLQDGTDVCSFFREFLWESQQEMCDTVIRDTGERYGGILSAMVLGEDCFVDDDVKELLQKSGIGHLLAISGLHVSFLGAGIYKLQRKLGIPFWGAAISSSIFLSGYILMIGCSVSALRAWIMFLLQMGANITGREYDGKTALSMAALILWIREPVVLFDAGFLLSFGAVAGIYIVAPRLKLRIPLAIQSVVLPIQLYYYYEICIYSLLWNILAIPLSTVVMGSGILGILLHKIPFLPEILAKLVFMVGKGVLWFYEKGSTLVLSFPGSRWILGQPEFWQMMMYYGILIICLICWNKKRILAVAGILLIGSMGIPREQLKISMLDIGQGDCFAIQNPDGGNHLIDGGSSSISGVGRYRIEPYLKQQGIGTLDYVWVSHGDADHVNGILELIQRKLVGIRIEHLILPPESYWNDALKELTEEAEKAEIQVLTMGQGQGFQDESLEIQCLWPPRNGESLEENQASMVLSLTFSSFDMLFTGDLEKEAEAKVTDYLAKAQKEQALPKHYEVLKVGHHGSKNATSEIFLKQISPQIALISAGEKNSYGHPHEETLHRLENINSEVFCTIEDGMIRLEVEKTGRMYFYRCKKRCEPI